MTESLPRPSIFFAAVSSLVIVINLFFLSALFAVIVVEPNPFAIMGGLFFAPLCIAMAVQQYRGTFRLVPSAATMVSVLFYVGSLFAVFALITTTGESIITGTSLRLMAPLLFLMFVVVACSVAFGRMNALWSRKIRSQLIAPGTLPVHRGFSRRELLIGVGVIVGMICFTAYLILTEPPRYAEHIDASAAPFNLPANARDISYYKGYRGTILFEFTTDESSFQNWVNSGIGSIESKSAGIPLREIVEPFTITRFNSYLPETHGPDTIEVFNGLYYSWWKEDRGVYAAYDRTTNRAFYHAHSH